MWLTVCSINCFDWSLFFVWTGLNGLVHILEPMELTLPLRCYKRLESDCWESGVIVWSWPILLKEDAEGPKSALRFFACGSLMVCFPYQSIFHNFRNSTLAQRDHFLSLSLFHDRARKLEVSGKPKIRLTTYQSIERDLAYGRDSQGLKRKSVTSEDAF